MIIKGHTVDDLKDYINHLIKVYFLIPEKIAPRSNISNRTISHSLERLEHCMEAINLKYFKEEGKVTFNPLHSDHLAMYLWFLADTHQQIEESSIVPELLSKINKYLHGIDLHYTVQMPDIFLLVHPLGTVIGKAEFSDYLVIYQNVTIGSEKNKYPKIGKYCVFYSKSSLLGNSELGDNVIMSANSMAIDMKIGDNKIACGQYPNVLIKNNKTHNLRRVFNVTSKI